MPPIKVMEYTPTSEPIKVSNVYPCAYQHLQLGDTYVDRSQTYSVQGFWPPVISELYIAPTGKVYPATMPANDWEPKIIVKRTPLPRPHKHDRIVFEYTGEIRSAQHGELFRNRDGTPTLWTSLSPSEGSYPIMRRVME